MEDAFTVLSQRIRGSGQRLLIAVDGRCASGKTTLAATLEEETGWNTWMISSCGRSSAPPSAWRSQAETWTMKGSARRLYSP